MVLTDESGEAAEEYEYGSYGEIIRRDREASRFLYNGAYGVMTDDNGLYYMRARYYHVEIRRFVNQDVLEGEITGSQNLNRYSYVQGNPVSLSDPFGLSPYMDWREAGHFLLDIIGFIPVVGDAADILNAVWYAFEGNWGMALTSVLSAIPAIGSFIGNGIKITVKGIDLSCAIAKTSKVVGYGYSSIRAGETAGNGMINMAEKYLVRKEPLGWDTLGEAGEVTLYTLAAIVSGKASVASAVRRVCFTGETLVETVRGPERIDGIKEGDYVLAENPETKEVRFRRVKTVYENETDTLVHVVTKEEEITTTPHHPFYVEGKGFVEAEDLKAGDCLKDADGRKVEVISVEEEPLEKPVRVYNLEVEEDHTYYVGRGRVLVHNQCSGLGKGETTSGKPNQVHHYATNKSKTNTSQLEEITNKYGLDLDDAWNKDLLPHQGRHPNAYHNYVLDSMKQFDDIAQGDKNVFLKLYDNLKSNIKTNPDMLYKDYWN